MKQLLVVVGLLAIGSVSSAEVRPHVACAAEDLIGRWDLLRSGYWCRVEINHGTIKQLACDPVDADLDDHLEPVTVSGKLAINTQCCVTGNVTLKVGGQAPDVFDFKRVLMDTGDDKRNFQGNTTRRSNPTSVIQFEAHYYSPLP